jgi:hypothetical protein
MFGKEKKAKQEEAKQKEEKRPYENAATASQTPAPRRPTALEILKKRRAVKMEQVKLLDKEIEMLDHDITYVERYPAGARILEFIAARFGDEEELPQAADTRPWIPRSEK